FTVVLSASMRDAAKSASAIATTATVCFRFIGASSAALRPMNLESKTGADRNGAERWGPRQARRSKGAEQARPPQMLRRAGNVRHVEEYQDDDREHDASDRHEAGAADLSRAFGLDSGNRDDGGQDNRQREPHQPRHMFFRRGRACSARGTADSPGSCGGRACSAPYSGRAADDDTTPAPLYSTLPPTIVYSTAVDGIWSSGTVRMSFDSTVMSASCPGVIDPWIVSSKPASAASIVYERSASIRLIR